MAEIRHISANSASQLKFYSLRIEYSGRKQKNKPPEKYRILKRFIFKEGMPYLNYDTPSFLVHSVLEVLDILEFLAVLE